MTGRTTYPAKIMLVGEYGVVVGGSALTIPFHRYRARIRSADEIPPGMEKEAARSGRYLEELCSYIFHLPRGSFHADPDRELFEKGIGKYWLEMTIPSGYGIGSSGAVSAAVYDLFFPAAGSLSLQKQKEDLAGIESFFHGRSSGVDALTCHANTPLLFGSGGDVRPVDFNPQGMPSGYAFFLLDSGERLETGPLVKHFLERMKENGFASVIRNEYLDANQKLIDALLGKRDADSSMLFRAVSDYQFTYFRKMIPDSVLDIWIEGQVTNEFYLKLNGSGGGFMLGITHRETMDKLEERWKGAVIRIE